MKKRRREPKEIHIPFSDWSVDGLTQTGGSTMKYQIEAKYDEQWKVPPGRDEDYQCETEHEAEELRKHLIQEWGCDADDVRVVEMEG